MSQFLRTWFVYVVAVLVAAKVVPGIEFQTLADLLVAGLLLGLLNAIVKPILMILSFPLLIVTLGLFMLVINAFLLRLVSFFMSPAFHVHGFKAAFWGGLVISIISTIVGALTGSNNNSRGNRPRSPGGSGPSGPVIDV